MDEKKYQASVVMNTLCQTLDSMEWKFDKKDDYSIFTFANGKNTRIPLFICVDEDKGVMYVHSPFGAETPDERVGDIVFATIEANISILGGVFDYDMARKRHIFKMVVPFMDCVLSEAACRYMILVVCQTVDRFSPKFKALAEGKITLEDFLNFARSDEEE